MRDSSIKDWVEAQLFCFIGDTYSSVHRPNRIPFQSHNYREPQWFGGTKSKVIKVAAPYQYRFFSWIQGVCRRRQWIPIPTHTLVINCAKGARSKSVVVEYWNLQLILMARAQYICIGERIPFSRELWPSYITATMRHPAACVQIFQWRISLSFDTKDIFFEIILIFSPTRRIAQLLSDTKCAKVILQPTDRLILKVNQLGLIIQFTDHKWLFKTTPKHLFPHLITFCLAEPVQVQQLTININWRRNYYYYSTSSAYEWEFVWYPK